MMMHARIVFGMLALLLLSSASPLATPRVDFEAADVVEEGSGIEWIRLNPDPDSISDAQPAASWDGEERLRPTTAGTHIGLFTTAGLESDLEVPEVLSVVRSDIALVIVEGDVGLWTAREALEALPGIEVRAYIPPSGFLLQGHPDALVAAAELEVVAAVHPLPLAFMVDRQVSELLASASSMPDGVSASTPVQLGGWRLADAGSPQDHVRLGRLSGDLDTTATTMLSGHQPIAVGRHLGLLPLADIATVAADPGLAWMSLAPVLRTHNNLAVGHMRADDVSNYFITDLNGSGQSITVADSGIDRDHGDFNGRIQHVESVTWGDSSTEDTDTGHGTHVACTVLGNGSRGGYSGVAPQAKLRFQAMEDDSTGNFGGVSMDELIRKAYEGNSHIHTNSWGVDGYFGEYTTSSEDVDSRTNRYDRFWSYDGMLVLISAGNDGPDADTITPPATAKNAVTVGNHHNRGGGAPSTLSASSSRGPTDDGRIKPDITAPGSWVRSCRSQDAANTDGSSWSNTWYLEYSGTSMAAPNAAGASILIREYLMEIAGRPAPQGALIKGLLILGAEDSGTRDIPNNDEGWGRVNLANSLIPGTDTGIWVDDRNTVRSGQTREYLFNLTRANTPLKAVLTWSDYPGSTWATKQLQNDLDMVVTAPDGTAYKGNDFASGRSTTGGDADDTNNVEVVLIDQAAMGVWTIRITDVAHGGQTSDQAFALAVRGAGVNDLRSDPLPLGSSFQLSTAIPQVNDVCEIAIQIQNQGGGRANGLRIEAIAGNQNLGEVEVDIGPGMTSWLTWDWTPITEGQQTITIRIDPRDDIEEIDEDNNMFETLVAVSAPGVRVTTAQSTKVIADASSTSTTWEFQIRNTALLPTNATITASTAFRIQDGLPVSGWFTSFTQTNFALAGAESSTVGFTLVHSAAPAPGLYQLTITAHDEDNDLDFPLTLTLDVPMLPGVSFQVPFSTLMVHPSEPTSFTIDVLNQGNGNQGYNLYIESPNGWRIGLDSLGSTIGATTGSTGAIPVDSARTVDMTVIPPEGAPPAAGLSLSANLRVISQVDPDQSWVQPIQIEVSEYAAALIEAESEPGVLRPDSIVYIQFTVTNLGNVDLVLQPDIAERPGGWSVSNFSTGALEIPIGDSVPYVLGLTGNGLAVGGPINLHLSTSDGYRTTWSSVLDVVQEAQPVVDFLGLADAQGMSLDEVPAGEPGFKANWRISNDGGAAWTPLLTLDLPDQTWQGVCDPVDQISPGSSTEVTCVITAPPFAMGGWQPEISLVVDAEGVERTSVAVITVASQPAVQWSTLSIDESLEGAESMIHLEIQNTGNTRIEQRIRIEAPEGWVAEVDGPDIVDLAIDETRGVRIRVVPAEPGLATVVVRLDGSDDIESATHTIGLDVIDDPESSSASGWGETVAFGGLILFILGGLALAGLLIMRLNKPDEVSPESMMTAIAPSLTAPLLAKAAPPSVVCWGCNVPITGPRRACPGCGARYHDSNHACMASTIVNCRNCDAAVATFVPEVDE
jgi:uncharacterized membrane protein